MDDTTTVPPAPTNSIPFVSRFLLWQRHDSLLLWSPTGQLQISDPTGSNSDTSLVVEETKSFSEIVDTKLKPKECFGCLGIIRLLEGRYLLVLESVEEVGRIKSASILRATKIGMVPIPFRVELGEREKFEKKYRSILKEFLDSAQFYYSHDHDLTNSLQRNAELGPGRTGARMWEKVDQRFVWNRYVATELLARGLGHWVVPVLDGFIRVERCEVGEQWFDYMLISRRSCARAGTRYQTRGADPQGNVANYVETEQVVASPTVVTSFVQTRGSIPLVWHQKGAGFRPKIVVANTVFRHTAVERHFDEQQRQYGRVVVANLVDQHGHEQPLGEEFELRTLLLARHAAVRYVAFDFHAACRGDRYEQVGQLVSSLADELAGFGLFIESAHGEVVARQTGTLRTNCVDCLDRTNVVQSAVGRHVLAGQLRLVGVVLGETAVKYAGFDAMLKRVWADNADRLSKQYTGTGALKTDYTRTGKRSVKGKLDDGVNAARRYLHKEFKDDDKQDAIELFLGRYRLVHAAPAAVPPGVTRVSVFKFHSSAKLARPRSDPASSSGPKAQFVHHDPHSKKSPQVWLDLDEAGRTLTRLVPHKGKCLVSPLASLAQLARDYSNPRVLALQFDSDPDPEEYVFSSARSREFFVGCIAELCPHLVLPAPAPTTGPLLVDLVDTSPSAPPSFASPPATLGLFVATCTLGATSPGPLSSWLPRGRDVYVLAAQNVQYERPAGYYGTAPAHWSYTVQAYLSPQEYHCIASHYAEDGSAHIIALVRQPLKTAVTNIRTTHVCPPLASAGKAVQSMPGRAVRSIKSWIGRGPAKDPAAGTPPSSSPSDDEHEAAHGQQGGREATGVAVSFRFHETALCFVSTPRQGTPFVLKDKHLDVANDFHHVFLLGPLDAAAVDELKYWRVAGGGPDGSVYWRGLPDCSLSDVVAGQPPAPATDLLSDVPAPAELATASAARPVFAYIGVKPVVTPRVQLDSQCVVRLTGLRAEGLLPANILRESADPYLVFCAPFIEPGAKTLVVRRSLQPVWPEPVELVSLFTDISYLQHAHLKILVMNSSDLAADQLLGACTISLKRAVGPQPYEFRATLLIQDQPSGVLHGTVHVKS